MRQYPSQLAISPVQLTALLILTRIEAASVFLPSLTTGPPTQDAWIATGMGALLALPPLLLLGWLSAQNDGACPVCMARNLLGRPPGSAIGVVLAAFFLLCGSCTMRHVLEAYTSVIMPETPGLAFCVLLVLVSVYASSCGVPVLGRTGALVCLFSVPLLVLVLLLSAGQMDPAFLQPVLDTPFRDLAKIASVSFSFSMQAVAGAMLFPYLKPRSPRTIAGVFVAYTAISTAILVASVSGVIASFGPLAHGLAFPVLSLARRVDIAGLIQRMEILPVTVWTASACMRIGLFLWAASACLAEALGLRKGRALIPPLGYLCVVMTSLIVKNVFQMLRFYAWDVWGIYGTVVQLGLVVLLGSAFLVRSLLGGSSRGRR